MKFSLKGKMCLRGLTVYTWDEAIQNRSHS